MSGMVVRRRALCMAAACSTMTSGTGMLAGPSGWYARDAPTVEQSELPNRKGGGIIFGEGWNVRSLGKGEVVLCERKPAQTVVRVHYDNCQMAVLFGEKHSLYYARFSCMNPVGFCFPA